MIPLAICSLAALTVIIERSFALRRSKVMHPSALDLVNTYRGEVSAAPGVYTCQRARGSLSRIVEEVIHSRDMDRAHIVESMQATGRREVGHLERGLTLLEIVAGISPLIGLLGTVLGMVTVFDAITAEGIGNPQVLSNGISKALVTTVAGLCIAIPSLAFHSYFSRRVESLAMEMQDVAMGFITKVRMPAPRPSKEVAVETMPFAEPQA
jgi:biopolymer transport protein ExbB